MFYPLYQYISLLRLHHASSILQLDYCFADKALASDLHMIDPGLFISLLALSCQFWVFEVFSFIGCCKPSSQRILNLIMITLFSHQQHDSVWLESVVISQEKTRPSEVHWHLLLFVRADYAVSLLWKCLRHAVGLDECSWGRLCCFLGAVCYYTTSLQDFVWLN